MIPGRRRVVAALLFPCYTLIIEISLTSESYLRKNVSRRMFEVIAYVHDT